ncbi:DUF2314 domain-containing protein [Cellulophaga sp. HaHaR_3_176]|uniref:YegJ family protein n=1 Tax=Cellulophaga sp. HaHaR_3_176 TaxID=1942464 RepID=UPI001C1F3BF7|nr:DUF2314 domain-containing protein [Cellulophaga sp. HaHaR_3_176]QWX84653.1 DUF2314 domain-containing protein [Cellulophaga sp. HaHaR_3_176]
MGLFDKLFGKKKNIVKREGNPDVYNMPNENERLNWAMEKARLTLHYFETCLTNPKDGQEYFSIKARIEDNGKTEHIWLRESSFDEDGNIFGIVGNEPIDVKNVSIDEKIGITKEHVSDWMIIENGKLIGGYTIRAIRDGLEGSGLVDFDKNLGGMLVDEGEDYFRPNLETPEGAILALEEAYDNDDLEAAMDCKDFYKEAEFILQKMNKIELDESIITKTAEVLKLSYIKNMQEHGMPKFAGLKRAFLRDKVSDDQYIITEICLYPDGGKSSQKMNTFKIDNQWKVLGLVD